MRILGAAAVLALAVTLLSPPAGSSVAALRVTCHGAAATVVGTSHHDHLVGRSGPDVIADLGGDDRIGGRGGDDVVCGNEGPDRLEGGRATTRQGMDSGPRDPEQHLGADREGRLSSVTGQAQSWPSRASSASSIVPS